MYSSRHNHALRRSREGSGRFVGGPVDNSAMTSTEASVTVSSSTSSEPIKTASTTTSNNCLPFSHHVAAPKELHQTNSESNTNNNNHCDGSEVINLLKSSSVDGEEQRGTVSAVS